MPDLGKSIQLHDMNPFQELFLIAFIVMILILVGRMFAKIKINGKPAKIPLVIVTVFLGFIIGLILRAIDKDFSFALVPHLSMISILILFISFGAMIDFKSFKKFGIWTLLIGTIPYLIEWIAITAVVILLTSLYWMEAAIVAAIISMCAPGVVSPKLIDNITKGYESKSNYNETVSLASAIESIFGLIVMIVLVIIYFGKYSPNGIATSEVILLPLILLISGLVLGALLGIFIVKVIKPASDFISRPYARDTKGLEGDKLKAANVLNEHAENKTNLIVWVFAVFLIIVIYTLVQELIGVGFLVQEVALVSGITVAIFASKSLTIKKTQKALVKNSNLYYGLFGSFIVWGFGGMLIDPAIISGNDWVSINGFSGSIPNVVAAIVIILIALIFRIIGIFTIMSFNKEFTLKQKLYTIPVMLSTGTSGVNNGITIFVVLGVTSSTTGIQMEHAILIQDMLIVLGALMTFTLIPIGIVLLAWGQDKLIFQWADISEGKYKHRFGVALKEEKIKHKKEGTHLANEYWKSFYEEKTIVSKYKKTVHKTLTNLELQVTAINEKINKLKVSKAWKINELERAKVIEASNLEFRLNEVQGDQEKIDQANQKSLAASMAIIDNIKLTDEKYEQEIALLENQVVALQEQIEAETNKVDKLNLPDDIVEAKNKLKENAQNLKNYVDSNFKEHEELKTITANF